MNGSGGPRLDLEQIQGLILNGYKKHLSARYVVFEVVDPKRARVWIREVARGLQYAEYRRTPQGVSPEPHDLAVNVAFTHAGFAALGLHPTALAGFSLPFQEGLADPNRARRLGDDGPSDPNRWAWGGPGPRVHGVLALFSKQVGEAGERELVAASRRHACDESGLRVVADLPAQVLDPSRREHFGFRDGIANPRLRGLARHGATDLVADGEFLLGYQNGYGRMPMSPEVPSEADPKGILPAATDGVGRRDFGKNGSYLVFRQMTQDVRAFWRYVYEAKNGVPGLPAGKEGAEWLASRLVGRWQNGTPITRYPDRPGPEKADDANNFLYYQHGHHGTGDEFGTRCPIGAHVRRTNPRDTALPAPLDVELSGTPEDPAVRDKRLSLSNLHRIMRRGRTYGPPADPEFDAEKLKDADDQPRGLHFLCFNADLSRQYEFVQSNWALNPSFAGLSEDPDPLLGAKRKVPFPADTFTMQGCPVRRVHDLPRVVEVVGGAYFFMPSRAALEYLGAIGGG